MADLAAWADLIPPTRAGADLAFYWGATGFMAVVGLLASVACLVICSWALAADWRDDDQEGER